MLPKFIPTPLVNLYVSISISPSLVDNISAKTALRQRIHSAEELLEASINFP
jgi:hypothetical protein